MPPEHRRFSKRPQKGDRIILYLMVVGGIEAKGVWEFVCPTNSFRDY